MKKQLMDDLTIYGEAYIRLDPITQKAIRLDPSKIILKMVEEKE